MNGWDYIASERIKEAKASGSLSLRCAIKRWPSDWYERSTVRIESAGVMSEGYGRSAIESRPSVLVDSTAEIKSTDLSIGGKRKR